MSCEWGGKTCLQTNSSLQYCSHCNGSSRYGGPLKICPLDKNEYYETYFSKEFKEIIIHDDVDRLIKSSPSSCMDDDRFDEKIQNCDSKKMWKHWLEWRTESESVNSLTRSKRRFWYQSFISLMADLRQVINSVSSFSRCLNGKFP